MIDPAKVCLFIPSELKKFKLDLFNAIGRKIEKAGGTTIRGDYAALDALPDDIMPIVGCSPELMVLINRWKARGRNRIQWDRGYARRVFATWLPKAKNLETSYYRWHLNCYQMQTIRDVPSDRWDALETKIEPWAVNPNGHIVLAIGSPTYNRCHVTPDWTERTIAEIRKYTDREIRVSDKETKVPLAQRIQGAHCLVTHGSNAATEAAIMGCPVFVHPDCAAALVGQTELSKIETPVYPDRTKWAHSLAYSQWNETELVDGTLWRQLV